MDNKYAKMNKEQVLLELAVTLKRLEDAEKEIANIKDINARLNYKINVLKDTIKQMVDRI
jgi:hypothetical protein